MLLLQLEIKDLETLQRKVRGTVIIVGDWQNSARDGLNPGTAASNSCNSCFEMLRSGWSVWRCFLRVLKSRGLRGRVIHHCHNIVCKDSNVGRATREKRRTRACKEGQICRVSCRSLPGWNTLAGIVMCVVSQDCWRLVGGVVIEWRYMHAQKIRIGDHRRLGAVWDLGSCNPWEGWPCLMRKSR